MREFVLGREGDMVERGLILVAIIVACIALWFTLGNKLAKNLQTVVSSF